MRDELRALYERMKHELQDLANSDELRAFEVRYLGRKGELTTLLRKVKELPLSERTTVGSLANELKGDIASAVETVRSQFAPSATLPPVDVTLPGAPIARGHIHPVTQLQWELEDFFSSLGFTVADGPEVESEFFNFEALNIPADHPARDMQDTFFVADPGTYDPDNRVVLRTQTSPVQIRAMRRWGAPLRLIAPGRCFRAESTDARHEHTFEQLEGLMVDRDISIAHLKGVLELVAHHLYGTETKVRLRPKFYPFVEPGFSGEVSCMLCQGAGCRVCKQTGWLEIFGAGLVHPHVLIAGGVDPEQYSGFAFGFGLTRLVMLRYGIDDVRLFAGGDQRFLEQF